MATASEHRGRAAARTAAERHLLMLLYAPGCTGNAGEPVRGAEWLRMQMYVLSRDVPGLGDEIGGFAALGPALDAAYGRCAGSGLVEAGRDGGEVRLTPRGTEEAEGVWKASDQGTREAVADAKDLLNDMGNREMTSFMCSEFPEVRGAPGIAGRFEEERLGAAASLARRHKVSIIKAASIAGMEAEDFEAELRRMGIRPYSLDGEAYEESLRTIDRISGH